MPFEDLSGGLSDLGSRPEFLGPPVQATNGYGMRNEKGRLDYDLGNFILPKKHGGMYGMPGGRPGRTPANPPSFGNDMGTPYPVADVGTITTVPDTSGTATTPATATGFDFSSLLSGNIMGIPTWIILAAAAYFLFFKKGR